MRDSTGVVVMLWESVRIISILATGISVIVVRIMHIIFAQFVHSNHLPLSAKGHSSKEYYYHYKAIKPESTTDSNAD